MKSYNLWMEGFAATGQSASASYLGSFKANTFEEACRKWGLQDNNAAYFNFENLTYWGCSLFDNEQDARRSFG